MTGTASSRCIDDVDSLLNKAERFLLKRRFKEALYVTNQAFTCLSENQNNKRWNGTCNSNDVGNVIPLSPSIQIPSNHRKYYFTVLLRRCNNNKKCVYPTIQSHQLASIALQCWHELSLRETKENRPRPSVLATKSNERLPIVNRNAWRHLEPLLNYFSSHVLEPSSMGRKNGNRLHGPALSVDLFTVWIPFWEHNGYRNESFQWTVQTLLGIAQRRDDDAKDREVPRIGEDEERLWLHCVCSQLPYLKDPKLALNILKAITTDAATLCDVSGGFQNNLVLEFMFNISYPVEIRPDSIQSLIDALEVLVVEAVDNSEPKCIPRLIPVDTLRKAHDSLLKTLNETELGTSSRSSGAEVSFVPEAVPTPTCDAASISMTAQCLGKRRSNPRARYAVNSKSCVSSSTVSRTERILQWIVAFYRGRMASIANYLTLDHLLSWKDSFENEKTRARTQTIVVSFIFLLMSWHRRQYVRRVGRLVAVALVSPLRELVEALVEPTQTFGSRDDERIRK